MRQNINVLWLELLFTDQHFGKQKIKEGEKGKTKLCKRRSNNVLQLTGDAQH